MEIKINIFYVEKDPFLAAVSLVDKHVVKMILESCQLLSTAHRVLDGELYIELSPKNRKIKRWRLPDDRENVLYKASFVNHPCAKWARESVSNYQWLSDHLNGLCQEYSYRYGKQHKCWNTLTMPLASPPFNLKKFEFTNPPCAMPQEYIISDDPITNYREYYRVGKKHLHTWSKSDPPEWIK